MGRKESKRRRKISYPKQKGGVRKGGEEISRRGYGSRGFYNLTGEHLKWAISTIFHGED